MSSTTLCQSHTIPRLFYFQTIQVIFTKNSGLFFFFLGKTIFDQKDKLFPNNITHWCSILNDQNQSNFLDFFVPRRTTLRMPRRMSMALKNSVVKSLYQFQTQLGATVIYLSPTVLDRCSSFSLSNTNHLLTKIEK